MEKSECPLRDYIKILNWKCLKPFWTELPEKSRTVESSFVFRSPTFSILRHFYARFFFGAMEIEKSMWARKANAVSYTHKCLQVHFVNRSIVIIICIVWYSTKCLWVVRQRGKYLGHFRCIIISHAWKHALNQILKDMSGHRLRPIRILFDSKLVPELGIYFLHFMNPSAGRCWAIDLIYYLHGKFIDLFLPTIRTPRPDTPVTKSHWTKKPVSVITSHRRLFTFNSMS